jgi:hypothetical protein
VRIISFAWTTPALLAGRKTVTRREWDTDYALRFQEGELVAAYDRSPRAKGKQVATVRLTRAPYVEEAAKAPDDDWEGEGFAYLTERGFTLHGLSPREMWDGWKADNPLLWVVRFEVVPS